MDEVVIGSTKPQVILSDLTTEAGGWRSYRVTVDAGGLRASRVVSAGGEYRCETDTTVGLVDVLRAAAAEYRGWEKAKEWSSLKEDWSVSITSDRTGHATCNISLFGSPYYGGWEARVSVVLDVMERERLAQSAESLFARRAA